MVIGPEVGAIFRTLYLVTIDKVQVSCQES
jgi:hypothetical protein